MYTLLILFYIGGIAYFARRVWQSIQKGGPMHEVSYINQSNKIFFGKYLP